MWNYIPLGEYSNRYYQLNKSVIKMKINLMEGLLYSSGILIGMIIGKNYSEYDVEYIIYPLISLFTFVITSYLIELFKPTSSSRSKESHEPESDNRDD